MTCIFFSKFLSSQGNPISLLLSGRRCPGSRRCPGNRRSPGSRRILWQRSWPGLPLTQHARPLQPIHPRRLRPRSQILQICLSVKSFSFASAIVSETASAEFLTRPERSKHISRIGPPWKPTPPDQLQRRYPNTWTSTRPCDAGDCL